MPPPTRGIRHVALKVRDLERMERFYVDVLGYVVEWRPSERELYLTRGEDNLALHQGRAPKVEGSPSAESGAQSASESTGALDHFGLLMDRAEDVQAWATHLEAQGVVLDTRPRLHRDGATSFYARDPEGNRIQFLHHPPIAAPA